LVNPQLLSGQHAAESSLSSVIYSQTTMSVVHMPKQWHGYETLLAWKEALEKNDQREDHPL